MKPLLLKGHQRAITNVVFNCDGDLLFSCAKDSVVCMWAAATGERIGTYGGMKDRDSHKGTVRQVLVSADSTKLYTAGEDDSIRIWEVETGRQLQMIALQAGVPAIALSEGETMLLGAQNSRGATKHTRFYVFDLNASKTADNTELHELVDEENERSKVSAVAWLPLNIGFLVSYDTGVIRAYSYDKESQSISVMATIRAHTKPVTSMSFNKDKTLLLSTSKDNTAKLWEVLPEGVDRPGVVLEEARTFQVDAPLNAGAISPCLEHVFIGGGQEARDVTTTAGSEGKFEMRIHHLVLGDELGKISGHFGTLNTCAITPDGRSYASGAEDGFVRLHHLDDSYFTLGDEKDMWHEDLDKWASFGDDDDA